MVQFASRVALAACLLVLGRPALAAKPDPNPYDRPQADWDAVRHRATIVAWVGLGAAAVGTATMGVGQVTSREAPLEVGVALDTASTPLLAGGALRARHALRRQGLPVDAGLGIASWTLYAASFPLWALASMMFSPNSGDGGSPAMFTAGIVTGSLAVGSLVGSWATGAALLVRERQAREGGGELIDTGARRRGPRVMLLPRIGRRSAGIGLAGAF